MRYTVFLLQTVTEGATIEVEADSEEEAGRIGLEASDEVKWHFLEASDPRVINVDEEVEL